MVAKQLVLAVAAVGVALILPGCLIWSQQNYGPQNVLSLSNMEDCLRKAGGPDVQMKIGENTMFVYHTREAWQIPLCIYGQVVKRDRILVFDPAGKQIRDEFVEKGRGWFILGGLLPIVEVE